ncbi:hypothetical protein [Chromobacterium phragmitis]|uniref:hypothetical protein n=1 Tax=Chromobacterium phragmitis TaxID=2202141 RepID=UPI003D35A143
MHMLLQRQAHALDHQRRDDLCEAAGDMVLLDEQALHQYAAIGAFPFHAAREAAFPQLGEAGPSALPGATHEIDAAVGHRRRRPAGQQPIRPRRRRHPHQFDQA